jgi:hypothetical protein
MEFKLAKPGRQKEHAWKWKFNIEHFLYGLRSFDSMMMMMMIWDVGNVFDTQRW